MEAAASNNIDATSLLLQRSDIMINQQRESTGDTALMIAALRGHKQIVKKLLAYPGVRTDFKHKRFNTTAEEAARAQGYTDVAELINQHNQRIQKKRR